MLISLAIAQALNDQYEHEKKNSHRYKARAGWAGVKSLTGIQKFFEKRSCEECGHAEKIYEFLTDRDEQLDLELDSTAEIFPEHILGVLQTSLAIEQETTDKLAAILTQARTEGDVLTESWLLKGLIPEQIEEEALFTTLLDRYSITGSDHLFDVWVNENFCS